MSNNYNSLSTLAGAIFPNGTTTVIWTVTDATGNTATCSFTITVNDSEDPTISCVINQTRDADPGVCTYTTQGTEFDPTAFNDNCPGSTVSNNYNSLSTLAGAIFPNGTTTVIWTVTDATGNTATCSFTITVNDSEDPTISCVVNQTRDADPGVCTYTTQGTEFDPTAFNDNCPGSTVSNNYNGLATLARRYLPQRNDHCDLDGDRCNGQHRHLQLHGNGERQRRSHDQLRGQPDQGCRSGSCAPTPPRAPSLTRQRSTTTVRDRPSATTTTVFQPLPARSSPTGRPP